MLMNQSNAFCVIGPPGCGKTYSISQSIKNNLERYGEKGIIVCSLTKTAAKEASGRVGLPKEQVGTLHSFAYRSIGGGEVAETHIKDWNKDVPFLAINDGSFESDIDDQTVDTRCIVGDGDRLSSIYNLYRAQCKPRETWPSSVLTFAKKWEEWKSANNFIDFSDMIERATSDTITAPGNPYLIYMDEAQDSSLAEARLLSHWGGMARKVVVVGDPYQSLYEWRGAEPDEFFPEDIQKERRHVLSQSYRVPTKVVDTAVKFLSRMPKYYPVPYYPKKDSEGTVTYSSVSLRDGAGVAAIAEKAMENGTVMILSSCGYMLKPVITALREAGLPFENAYRRKNGAWNPLVSRGISARERLLSYLAPSDMWEPKDQRMWTVQDIQNWVSVLISDGILHRGAKTAIKNCDPDTEWSELGSLLDSWFTEEAIDKIYNSDLDFFEKHLQASKIPGMSFPIRIAKKRGPYVLRDRPKITVGTVHSVKGGESDTVILAPDLSLAGYEEWMASVRGVFRLFYVGMTRAKENLILLSPSNMMAVEW